MTLSDRPEILEAALEILSRFAAGVVRGRFISLYFGLRRMRAEGKIAGLGGETGTLTQDIQEYLDRLYTKKHRPGPYVVLTSPFGGSTAKGAPYSARSGTTVPGMLSPVNTWRNNLGIQKGVGCAASAETIGKLLDDPQHRLACPHMESLGAGRYRCGIRGTEYRGEEHSIWLRNTTKGYQVVDLDHLVVFRDYLHPNDHPLPVFPVIAMLYCMASPGVFPERERVGIPELAEDFGFTIEQVGKLFDCDPESPLNSELLSGVAGSPMDDLSGNAGGSTGTDVGLLPKDVADGVLNSGVGAELLIAQDLHSYGWKVLYRGNQPGLGYDLEASRDAQRLYVEVKSSIGFANLELRESEWVAAQACGGEYVLAVVDFFGSSSPRIWYVRDPAANAVPDQRTTITYRFARTQVEPFMTEVDFL